jgi:hypothetical protein
MAEIRAEYSAQGATDTRKFMASAALARFANRTLE